MASKVDQDTNHALRGFYSKACRTRAFPRERIKFKMRGIVSVYILYKKEFGA